MIHRAWSSIEEVPLCFGVICQMLRLHGEKNIFLHGPKNRRFRCDLDKITKPVAPIKWPRFVFWSSNLSSTGMFLFLYICLEYWIERNILIPIFCLNFTFQMMCYFCHCTLVLHRRALTLYIGIKNIQKRSERLLGLIKHSKIIQITSTRP